MEATAAPRAIPLPMRLVKIFFSPGEVFDQLKENPAWFGALATVGVVVAFSMIIIPADIWAEAMRVQAAERGTEVPEFMTSAGSVFRITSAVSALVGTFLWAFVLAGIVTVVFSFLLGDEGSYKQYLSVVSHALFIGAVGSLLLIPLRIAQGDPSLTLNLATFLPFLQEGYAFRVLKMIDLFGVWSYGVMAIGVTRIDPRRGMGLALTFFMAFMVVFALIFGIFGG